MEFADLVTGLAAIMFGIATWFGIRSLNNGSGWLMPAVAYVTIVAFFNCLFRVILFIYRMTNTDRPYPATVNIALVLQVALAVALLLIAAVTRMQSKAGQYDT